MSIERQTPLIKTELPGPVAKTYLERDEHYISPSYTRSYPLVVKHGDGMMVEDVDGNIFLDFAAGIAVTSTGHRHPKVVEAIKKGLDEGIIHMSGTDFYYPSQADLAERLAKAAGGKREKRVFFSNSGTESIECALKLARWHTKRTNFISMRGAFHGRTFGAMSVGNSKARHRSWFGPLVPGVHHVPFPNVYRDLAPGQKPEELAEQCLRYIHDVTFKREVEPDQVAAIIVEPVQGEGGYLVPPPNFLPGLHEICADNGILLIVDEVQAGMGRTGKLFAHHHFNVEPDIIATAKGIASGMPLGATIAAADIMQWPSGTHASTFGGNPLSCRAALVTLDMLQSELIANSARMGEYLLGKLKERASSHPKIGDVRGLGLMIAAECVADKTSKKPAGKLRDRIIDEAFKRGLALIGCGESCVRFCPALSVRKEHIDTAVDIFGQALDASKE
ncbi:MAG: acetyl ornithine aminotransferase family protein [Planctomycetes bacterium]|nr:acetyl ornithine aminotransferase family protein [Planctomycetota bacterium]NUQ35501.1 acetyl ornithine aminotransferase family protein [Planctomycetaceae bacterium]